MAKNPLHFEKLTIFYFLSLRKKISSLESYLKRVGFEDKGQGFPKKLFFIALSQSLPPPKADLRKTAVLTLS
jgi:hypothetical protein